MDKMVLVEKLEIALKNHTAAMETLTATLLFGLGVRPSTPAASVAPLPPSTPGGMMLGEERAEEPAVEEPAARPAEPPRNNSWLVSLAQAKRVAKKGDVVAEARRIHHEKRLLQTAKTLQKMSPYQELAAKKKPAKKMGELTMKNLKKLGVPIQG